MADRDHAHQLIDELAPAQLAAIVRLLEVMTDPVAASLAALDAAHESIQRGEGVPHEEILPPKP